MPHNPFQYLYEDCNSGDSLSKHDALPAFPTHVDVELTDTCNFRCKMCPTGNLSMKRPAGFMEWETFDKIVEQCEPHGAGIRMIGWGEPMLHPQIFRYIRRASDALLPTHLNTNGSKLGDYEVEMLLLMGLDSIKFSFQGVTREGYEDMRNVDHFEALFHTVRKFFRRRGGYHKPFISVSTTITDEHPSQVEVFKRRFGPICDQLSIGHTTFDFIDLDEVRLSDRDISSLKDLASRQTVEKHHPNPCPEVFDKLAIAYDGSVRVCCNDANGVTNLGNVNETPLADIWRHPEIEAYRERLSRGEYSGPLCSVCYDYMNLTGVTDA